MNFNTSTTMLELFDGTKWHTFVESIVADLSAYFFLPVDGNATDSLGNLTFTAQANVTEWDTTDHNSGSASLMVNVYSGSAAYALSSNTTSTVWSLNSSTVGNFEFDWYMRHTADSGYADVLFTNTVANWPNSQWTYTTGGSAFPSGWAIVLQDLAQTLYFLTPSGNISWTYPGESTAWRHVELRRVGSIMELFIDGLSQGQKPAPTITDSTAHTLYLCGSTNGTAYTQAQHVSDRYQLDDIRFHAPP
jgi:hypothetical protein